MLMEMLATVKGTVFNILNCQQTQKCISTGKEFILHGLDLAYHLLLERNIIEDNKKLRHLFSNALLMRNWVLL